MSARGTPSGVFRDFFPVATSGLMPRSFFRWGAALCLQRQSFAIGAGPARPLGEHCIGMLQIAVFAAFIFSLRVWIYIYTLPETNSSRLKMDGWKMIVSFWGPLFLAGAMLLVSGSVYIP